jgi:hypothetical protein
VPMAYTARVGAARNADGDAADVPGTSAEFVNARLGEAGVTLGGATPASPLDAGTAALSRQAGEGPLSAARVFLHGARGRGYAPLATLPASRE